MTKMHRIGRWLVNRRTEGRARRGLAGLGRAFPIPASVRVLELGSGRGGLVALLPERYRPARLVGTDYDSDQVEAAREFLHDRWGSLPESVELRTADALALPFAEGTFDFVFAMMMRHHVEERHHECIRRPSALKEIRRVLGPGGQLVYSEMFRRAEIRASLSELGFTQLLLRSGWRHDLAVYRAPG
jgi:SAM-dependent methyltransferase